MNTKEIKPMLAASALAPFTQPGWIFEPKFDGIRAIASMRNGVVTIKSRGGLDLNHRFPDLVKDLAKTKDAVLDGEIVALDKDGKPSFQLLQQHAVGTKKGVGNNPVSEVVYYVFDILFDRGTHLTSKPLSERKKILATRLRQTENIRLVRDLPTTGEEAFYSCLKHGLEGIVAKLADSIYQPGQRSNAWIKVKGKQTAEFVIGGYTEGTGSRKATFGSLLLGYYDRHGQFQYAGGVGTGFDESTLRILLSCMKSLKAHESPFSVPIKGKGKPRWVIPHLVAEIQFAEMTQDKILRAPIFLRLRDDITAEEAGPRTAVSPPKRRHRKTVEELMKHGT